MSNINELLYAAYVDAGATALDLPTAEYQALVAAGASDGTWYTFLRTQGYDGDVGGMLYKYLGDKGYTGVSLNERIAQAAAALDLFGGWTPADIAGLSASVYGDWFRADLQAPTHVAGVFSRWTGLREDGDANARFDITPYVYAPSVAAVGPNGVSCIRMTSASPAYLIGSEDRAGSSSLYIPSPFASSKEGDGFCVAALIRMPNGGGDPFLPSFVDSGGVGSMGYLATASVTERLSVWHSGGTPIAHVTEFPVGSGEASEWHVVLLRRESGTTGKFSIWIDNTTSTKSGETDDDTENSTMYRWLMGVWLTPSDEIQLAGFVRLHLRPTDEECGKIVEWLQGAL